MTLAEFEQLTGITVPANDQTKVEAQIQRTQRMLEAMLGFTLDPDVTLENLYNEQGKTATECACPNVDLENLEEPDEVIGAYRLYPYNPNDKYLHVDPFTQVHQVKLVWNNVTVKTFDSEDYRVNFNGDWGKFIENCQHSLCDCGCRDCVQLAVDADWLFSCDSSVDSSVGTCINEELLYVWADMISYYADCKKDVKSETIGSHSYTLKDTKPPEELAYNLKVLKKFAGPHGTLTKVITL